MARSSRRLGPGARGHATQTLDTPKGPVTVMSGSDLPTWLQGLATGTLGEDYAGTLYRELHELARERDRRIVKDGRVLQWLARTR